MLKKIHLWQLLFYVAVATYCCFGKVGRTLCTAIVLYLLKTIFVIANGKYCRNTKAALFQEE